MTRLLVSVRSAEEAACALAGGADLIDVKEPANGPLGRPDLPAVAGVVEAVAARVPVSAALGELLENDADEVPAGVGFVKWGLSGSAGRADALDEWLRRHGRLPGGVSAVAVAYADHEAAGCWPPERVAELAALHRFNAFLIDTFRKDGRTLTDHVSTDRLAELRSRLADAGVKVALAGSLGERQIEELRPLQPDWFAVRGAACEGGVRGGGIDRRRVARLKAMLARGQSA